VYRRGLANTVQSADALLKEFWVRRKIKEHEVMRELEVPPLTADL
jgi:hypothetical protein